MLSNINIGLALILLTFVVIAGPTVKILLSYGDNLVLERLNLTVEQGEFVSMVGASGCGKSTFLNMLLGKESPTKGKITLENKPLIQEPDAERGIVFQKYSVFPHLTVLQNVMIVFTNKILRRV